MNKHRTAKSSTATVRCGAFTLIELLVVIAIIAILASLLLPALARAKEKARATLCLSNVKQWSTAFWMYGDDFEDYFPYEGAPGAIHTGNNLQAWYNSATEFAGEQKLMDLYAQGNIPLGGSRSIFSCPSTSKATPNPKPDLNNGYFMYGFNNRMDPNGPAQFKRSDVRLPAETVTFTENSEGSYPSTSGDHVPARHSLRAALGFADGHASLVSTNDYRRNSNEDSAPAEWSKPRVVYWYPYPTAPQ
jgi:prepilin-type N-terminal cleavage/methylation domain-containing protein/prepilin-type processing-associated H-X9-DG protein